MYKLIIFGIGNGYENIKKYIDMDKVIIEAFSDNDSRVWNTKFDGLNIINPKKIDNYEYDYIFITSMYHREITEQLISNGIDQKKIISYFNKSKYDEKVVNTIMDSNYNINEEIQFLKKYNQKIVNRIDIGLLLQGKILIERIKSLNEINSLKDIEFKIFSQWGEDGIIQYLINKIPIENEVFIEFGVENYIESNTRFLLINNNWSGLVIDGSKENIDYIKNDPEIYWKYDLSVVQNFITIENINEIIRECNISGDIGLLSIDIDGNDYWVWENIDCISPRIIICEYNSVFGEYKDISIPYKSDFYRTHEHYSNLYFGASLKALCRLADSKGYEFIGCNSAGVNAFFVRKDLIKFLDIKEDGKKFIQSKFRESRNKSGDLTFISGKERLSLIKDKIVFDFENMKERKIKDIYNI